MARGWVGMERMWIGWWMGGNGVVVDWVVDKWFGVLLVIDGWVSVCVERWIVMNLCRVVGEEGEKKKICNLISFCSSLK